MDICGTTGTITIPSYESQNRIRIALDEFAIAPYRAHSDDAGLDLMSPFNAEIPAFGTYTIDTGVHIAIPKGYAGFLKSRSGLNINHSVTTEGVIDCGYTGSIVVKMYNFADEPYQVKRGDKITQLVIVPIKTPELILVHELEGTERGNGGFGSSGR